MMLHCEAGKGSRYGGHPEERRVCALKIIIDPRGEERDLYGSGVLFLQFTKHLNLCVFSFALNGNLGRCSGRRRAIMPMYS